MDPNGITLEELQLAARNHGMPLEALRHAITPAGLHYLLIHYDIPAVDAKAWRLEIGGAVERPLQLSLEDLRARPAVTLPITLECAGNARAFGLPRAISQPWLLEAIGTAEWTGTPLQPVLEEAGLRGEAAEIVFTGLDRGVEAGVAQHYERSLAVEEIHRGEALLVWGMNGEPIPPQHGFPVRLVVPGWYGMASVKWLHRITAVSSPFQGYQQAHAYRERQRSEDEGIPLTRILPRSLMAPPGIPEFPSRIRVVTMGDPIRIEGRAWSGWGPIERVEMSTDGGDSWHAASVEPPPAPHAWQKWSYRWRPQRSGDHVLCCRAADAAGNEQPTERRWNLGGYADNSVQRVHVRVEPPDSEDAAG